MRIRWLIVVVALGLIGGCSGDGGGDELGAVSTYRVTIEPILASGQQPPDTDLVVVDIDAAQDLGRAVTSVSSAEVCPDEVPGDSPVERETVFTTRSLFVRTIGCGPEIDVWQEVANAQLIFLLTPARLDLDDPQSALERRFGTVFDGDLLASYPTDCARLGRPFCDSIRRSGGDPALFAEAGAERLVFDVDLDDSGRVSSMLQQWIDEQGEPVLIDGITGQRFRITDYGIPIEIEIPTLTENSG